MGLWKRGRRYWTQTVVNGVRIRRPLCPAWINSRDDELAGGVGLEKELIRAALQGSLPPHEPSDQAVRSRRRLSQGEESHRQHASERSTSTANGWRS